MTFAELLVFFILSFLVYRSLGPIQRRIEALILRLTKGKHGKAPIIDITDYTKKP